MGGNVGDAVAPLVAGALLAVFSWRQVVLINVIPGIVMSVLILLYIGRLYTAEQAAGTAARSQVPMTGARAARFQAAARQPHADLPVVGSVFRSMTQGGSADLPAALSRRDMGYSTLLDRRLHGRPAGRRLHRRADRRAPVRHHGPPADVMCSMTMTA